jgi:hypothetical protein
MKAGAATQRNNAPATGGRGPRIGRYDEPISDEGFGEEAGDDDDEVQHATDPRGRRQQRNDHHRTAAMERGSRQPAVATSINFL